MTCSFHRFLYVPGPKCLVLPVSINSSVSLNVLHGFKRPVLPLLSFSPCATWEL